MQQFLSTAEKVAAATACDLPAIMGRRMPTPEEIMAYGDAIAAATLHKVMAPGTYHEDGTQPNPSQIFVFGSNLAGVHGAGAARAALEHYGAIFGEGIGLVGMSYALPTKDKRIETLPVAQVQVHVANFKQFAISRPDLNFFVTRVGCGLAGFTDDQIAPMFRGCPGNCDFPVQWKRYLEPSEVAQGLVSAYAAGAVGDKDKWIEAAASELLRLATEVGVLRVETMKGGA